MDSVSSWNWFDYTKKHVEVWKHCIAEKNNKQYKYERPIYQDGVNSISKYTSNNEIQLSKREKRKLNFTLFKGSLRHKYYINFKKTNKK